MAAPDEVTPIALRVYRRMPDEVLTVDSLVVDPIVGDHPALRYMAAIADQLQPIVELLDRFTYTSPEDGGPFVIAGGVVRALDTSDLVDPATAEVDWLDWLAQHVGIELPPALPEAARRDVVDGAVTGWLAGSTSAVENAAKVALTGAKYARVDDHSTDAGVGTGGEWDILITTRTSQTPDVDAVLEAIVAANAAPSGVILWHRSYAASWDVLEAAYPTNDDWDAVPSWDVLEETGAP